MPVFNANNVEPDQTLRRLIWVYTVCHVLRPWRPRRTEGDFQFDEAPGWAMPNCTTTQKILTKLEFLQSCFTYTIYNT